eukprot:3677858-Pleurochrysis_carterae.AAC.1
MGTAAASALGTTMCQERTHLSSLLGMRASVRGCRVNRGRGQAGRGGEGCPHLAGAGFGTTPTPSSEGLGD